MRGAPAWRILRSKSPTSHSFQHPSSVSALRADPPSPTRGEGEERNTSHDRSGRGRVRGFAAGGQPGDASGFRGQRVRPGGRQKLV
ncbi:hypothetical protein EN823_15865 [bacterium M00.F.Ca.ET.180.01.1.1]|nr:hypothetical protein EN823_15865 [bacterium M00.F.Ca.ET.180.01.1.1]